MKPFLKKIFVISFLVLLFLSGKLYSITDTLDANLDNTLYEDEFGSYSNGKGQYFFAGNTLTDRVRRGLISFGVNNHIPPGAVIENVELVLYMSRSISGSTRVKLFKVTKYWSEGNSVPAGEEGSGAQSEPGDATWLHNYYDSQFWTNSGGDYSNVESGSANVEGIGYYTWNDAQMAADVQAWVNNQSPDYGWMLIGNESDIATAKRFDSKDNVNPSLRPRLIITYTFNEIALRMTAFTEGFVLNPVMSAGLPQSIPDTFRVYLRNSFTPYSVVDSALAYSGTSGWYVFNNASSGSYYIMADQRNSINTWSRLPQSYTVGAIFNYDFTTAASQAFGNNLVLKNSVYCFYSGDVNKDNFVNLTDVLNIYNDAAAFQDGYVVTDVNGDGIVDLTDIIIAYNNSTHFVQEMRP